LLIAALASHGFASEARADTPADDPDLDAQERLIEEPMFGGAATLADDDLDELRGGFILPNGMDVAIGIDIQTSVNGVLALRTMLTTADAGLPVMFVGDGSASANSAQPGTAFAMPGGGMVRVVNNGASQMEVGAGEQRIEPVANGPAVATPAGSVQLFRDGSGSQVVLNGDSLELRHMVGNFTGSIVANTANDRSISTVVTVNVDLQNSAVPLGNALLRWDSIAVDAASRGIR
jgi:hypothetical protein